MKRFALGILIVLALTLVGGVAQTSAAPGGPGRRPPPGPSGQVASVEGSTIVVTTPQGTVNIVTTASTTFEVNGASGSLSGISAGMFVHADGSKAADGTFTATRVMASTTAPKGNQPPKGAPNGAGVGGQVVSVEGSTITITTPRGNVSIATTGSTTFEVNGASGSISGITAGMFVRAEGTKAADGTFTATRVIAGNARPARPAPPRRR